MKLLISTGLYPPQIGGPASYSKLLNEELPKYGVSVRVVNFGTVRHLPFGIRHFVFFLNLLSAGFRADIIYAQDTVSVGVPSALVSVLLMKPLWVRVPGHHEWEQATQRFGVTETLDSYIKNPSDQFFLRLMRLLTRFVFYRAERIIAPSHYLADLLTFTGVPREKVKVIYSSVRKPDVSETQAEARRRLRLSGKVILSAGRLVPWKGFQKLISTFATLKQELPEATLVIVGEGPQAGMLAEHALTLGVHDSVQFTGSLPQAELFSYIRASDVFVLNTAYEGLSHLLIEVMMLGTPIVTTPVGGNAELITDGKQGIFVPYNEENALLGAFRAMLGNPLLGQGLSQEARKRGEQFASENSISAILEEFRKFGYLA